MQRIVGTVRVRRMLGVGIVALAMAVPAACGGSQLSPAYVKSANDAVSGQAGGAAGSTTGDVGTTGDTGTPGTTGTGTTGGTSTGGTGGSTAGTGGSTAGGSTTGGTTTGGTTTGGTTTKGGGGPVVVGVKAGSCAGFKNQTGITDSTITISNSSDISGPVPGLFTSAQQATKAYVAYFNATSNICGRKLDLLQLDSRTDAGADQAATAKACESSFAMVGSQSAFDSGGAATAQACGLPDIQAAAVTADRNNCSTCFGANATGDHEFENAVPDYFVKNYKSASQHAAFLYLNAGAASENAATQIAVEKKRGMKFLYTAGIDVSEFNYGPFVQAMKDKGVQWVQFLGSYQSAVRLAQAMQQASFKPQVYLGDPTIYNPDYVKTGGSAVDGSIAFIDFTPFEEASSNRELQLYRQWLQQVAPGAAPTFFGLFAWSAAKLFVKDAIELGGKLNRASLVAKFKTENNWTADGLHVPQMVGRKQTASCWRFIQLRAGTWVPLKTKGYTCTGVSKAS